VEELPQILKKDISKEDAEKIKAIIVEAGGEVAFE
jgi:ribosomal protein L7/L12